MTTRDDKRLLRARMKTVLNGLSPDAVREKSSLITGRLFATSWWNEADTVLAFCSMPREVDTGALLAGAMEQLKTTAIPRIHGEDLIFHLLRRLDADLAVGPLHLREPRPDWPVLDIGEPRNGSILIVTPGLVFDRRLNRLGRGKGFYDRFLKNARMRAAGALHAVGVCFSEQLIDTVPAGDHDLPVDGIITENETLR
ncbi:MAG TPA: 5-formyltetrahydrofolate cyclo-ligase [Acidobacteriota bacterium]|nr:5-formyltetrahydrofolate cyclo-ligase [Acidobacteriota bacterium]